MVGRTKEIQRLKEIYNSKKAEFVAVYGRRRVGKTFLINEIFKGKYTFRHTGLSPIEMDDMSVESPKRKQLKAFYNSLILFGMKKSIIPAPVNKNAETKSQGLALPCLVLVRSTI